MKGHFFRGALASLLVILLLLQLGCDVSLNEAKSLQTLSGTNVSRTLDEALVAEGKWLFEENCKACHGVNAQGAKDWRQPDADGFYPPPPLNGSGHAWHHSTMVLKNVIKYGSARDEQGRVMGKMPAWDKKLDDRQLDALISWFQSFWPDPVYASWFDREQRALGK